PRAVVAVAGPAAGALAPAPALERLLPGIAAAPPQLPGARRLRAPALGAVRALPARTGAPAAQQGPAGRSCRLPRTHLRVPRRAAAAAAAGTPRGAHRQLPQVRPLGTVVAAGMLAPAQAAGAAARGI